MFRRIFLAIFLAIPMTLFAAPDHHQMDWDLSDEEMVPYNQAIGEFLAERSSDSLGEITIGEMQEISARLSVIAQEEDYVRRARVSSLMMPGAGHFVVGENGKGALLTTGSVLIGVGTVIGAYFVLPNAVQFDEVDYINDSFRDIGQAWDGQSIASIAPAVGVLFGGIIVHAIVGQIASSDAEKTAREQIESGEKRFEPQPFFYPDANGRLILGARIGY